MSYMSDPGDDIVEVTKSDTANNAAGSRGVYLPVAGTVKFTTKAGNDRTLALTAGWHPINIKRVWTTGTDSGLVVCVAY